MRCQHLLHTEGHSEHSRMPLVPFSHQCPLSKMAVGAELSRLAFCRKGLVAVQKNALPHFAEGGGGEEALSCQSSPLS
jgi:hypothetical protein